MVSTTLKTLTFAVFAVALTSLAACQSGSEQQAGGEAGSSAEATDNPVVLMSTSKGDIKIELDPAKAPISVENFLSYVDSGHYDGTIFHRVIAGFMIQGGGFDSSNKQKETRPPIKNEADNGLENKPMTIAMARTSVVDSATSQFFINVADNQFLNHKGKTAKAYGYAVFGRVIEGQDIVTSIENTPTANRGGAFANAPVEPVVIKSVKKM